MRIEESPPEVARHQGGTFTREQARAEGWSQGQIERRLASGRWRVLCGKALTAERATTPTALAWGARLTWPDAVTSHTTAAALYGFPVPNDDRAHVTLRTRRSSIRGICVHHLELDDADVVRTAFGPVRTAKVRTALDCLRYLPLDDGLPLYAWLFTRDMLDGDALERAIAEDAGRWGNRRLEEILQRTKDGALSEAERAAHALLRRAGITGWIPNAPVWVDGRLIAKVDILFEKQRVVVEIDGWSAHAGHEAFQRDRRRQNELQNAGYLVLRFTWEDLARRGNEVLRHITEALRSRA